MKRIFDIGESVLFYLNGGYIYGEKIDGVIIDKIEGSFRTAEYIVEYKNGDKTNVIRLNPNNIYRDLRKH